MKTITIKGESGANVAILAALAPYSSQVNENRKGFKIAYKNNKAAIKAMAQAKATLTGDGSECLAFTYQESLAQII